VRNGDVGGMLISSHDVSASLSLSPMVAFPNYHHCTVLWSDKTEVYAFPPSTEIPISRLFASMFRLKVDHITITLRVSTCWTKLVYTVKYAAEDTETIRPENLPLANNFCRRTSQSLSPVCRGSTR